MQSSWCGWTWRDFASRASGQASQNGAVRRLLVRLVPCCPGMRRREGMVSDGHGRARPARGGAGGAVVVVGVVAVPYRTDKAGAVVVVCAGGASRG